MQMNALIHTLILIISTSCFRHNVLGERMDDILEASTDFLEKMFSEEVDFDSPDAFSEEWVEKAELVMKKYIQRIKEVHNLDQHNVDKRGTDEQLTITRDYQGVNALTRIEELYDTTAQYPRDITIFYLSNDKGARELYAATLQLFQEDPELEKANLMVVYKYEGDRFRVLDTAPVMGGVDIESFNIKDIPYIVCAEYDAGSSGRHLEGSVVYRLVDKKLQFVQTLNTKYPSDIAIWEDLNEVYMAVAISQVNQSMQISYEAESIVFRWLGEHFDSITTIKTYNAKCVTPFKIGSTMFLAVANHMNNQDETDIDSEIFKYNLNEDRFLSHQKIRTHGVMDIKFFSSANKRKSEHFIVVANSFEIGLDGNRIYETGSIIYKYADDYFVPFQSILLNAATQWLSISGPRGELVLIAACSSGIQAFQYDGWRFVETKVQHSGYSLGPGISSMRSIIFGGGSILAVANKNKHAGDADIFNLKFKPKYDFKEFHSDLYNWCERMIDEVDADDLNDLMQMVESSPKEDDDIVYVKGDLIIENGSIQKLETNMVQIGDGIFMNEDTILELNNHTDIMNYLLNDLEMVSASIKNSMKASGENHIQGSLKFENLSMTCLNCEFKDAYVTSLNGENVDRFLQNVVYLTEGLVFHESMTFEKVTVESFQDGPQYFNGKSISALVGRSTDTYMVGTLQIKGTVTLADGLSVLGNLDGLPFSSRTLLFSDQDQSLDGSISVRNASVNNLDAETLNYVNASQFFHGTVKVNGYHEIYTPTVLANVDVSSMKINGLLNNVDLESMVNSTMKVCGDQILNGNWGFEKLKCGNFTLGLISGYNLGNDFVKINGFEYFLDKMDFNAPLTVKYLHVVNDFNGISVSDGKLNVLPLNPVETVTIVGKKEFESLHIKSKLKVLESFNDLRMEEWNSVKIVHDPLYLNGDAVIHGKFSINGNLRTGDFKDNSGRYSLKKVFKHGVKLGNSTFTAKSLTLSGKVEVDNVIVERINDVKTKSWVRQNGKQAISGLKIFDDGMQVLKPIIVTGLINGLNFTALDEDVLRTYGNQTIYGVKIFKNMEAPSFTAGECLFENQWCNDLLFTDEFQSINGTSTIHGSVSVIYDLSVDNLTVEGDVAGYDLKILIEDTLYDNDKDPEVKAPKTFKGNLTFGNLEVSGDVGVLDIRNLLTLLYAKQFTTAEGSVIISQPTTIKNIQLTGWLNEISHEDLGSSWLLNKGEQTIKGNQVFNSIIAKQDAVLLAGKVNGWDLQEMVENAAMTNEDGYLGSVKLDKATTESLQLEGLIQGLNITDIVLGDDDEDLEISAKKVFKSNLIIEGEVTINGDENQFYFEKMCELFNTDAASTIALTVEGNVEMDVEPFVVNINDMNLMNILSEVWMADRDIVLNGYKGFSEMIFIEEVEVEGLVDGVDVKSLPQRYLSKTKDQIIDGMVSFPGGVTFEKTLTAPKAYVEGLISGINLEEFISRILLSGPDQSFTGVLKFEEITIEGHLNVGAVNGMDLDKDVMHLERDLNIIKGKLAVKSVSVDELRVGEGASVQGIDIPLWKKLAVKTYGDEDNSMQAIKGTKTLVNAEFKSNLWLEGKLDQIKFDSDHIMLLAEEQLVKGKKSFLQNRSLYDKNAFFAHKLEVYGHLNDVDISDFLSRLVHRNEDIMFTVPKTFTNHMEAENVLIKGLYHGVNISGVGLNEVSEMYSNILSKYDELYTSSSEIVQESLKRRAVYASYYQLVQDIEGRCLVLPILCDTSDPLLAVIRKENETNTSLNAYVWDSISGLLPKGDIGIDLENVSFFTPLQCATAYFVYIEFSNEENSKNQDTFIEGYFLEYTSKYGFTKSNEIMTSGTSSAVPVLVPLQSSCFFLAQWNGPHSMVVCKRRSLDQIVVFQKIPTYKIYEASSGLISNSPYIAYIMDADEFPEKGLSKLHVWVYANQTERFELLQEILIEGAQSVGSIEYHDISYLVVSSGSVPNAVQTGMIKIYRVNPELGIFVHWINLDVLLPLAVRFSVLSSGELVLYVSTKNPAKPFIVYLYIGVAGFKELTYAAHAPIYSQITTFSVGEWNNIVVLSGIGGTKLFKPAFKGI